MFLSSSDWTDGCARHHDPKDYANRVGSIAESAICVPKSERSIVPGLVPGPYNTNVGDSVSVPEDRKAPAPFEDHM
jgi:hypothetical protein